MPIGETLCTYCKHFRREGGCAAFPGHIPDELFHMAHDHRLPYPGDGGTRFEMRDGVEPVLLRVFDLNFGPGGITPPPAQVPARQTA